MDIIMFTYTLPKTNIAPWLRKMETRHTCVFSTVFWLPLNQGTGPYRYTRILDPLRKVQDPTLTAARKVDATSNKMDVEPKIGGNFPKMDGENNGKPYEQMGWFGGKHHYFWKHPHTFCLVGKCVFFFPEGYQKKATIFFDGLVFKWSGN